MKKKIMALMLIIPILLTFVIFSLSKTAAIIVDVHVNGIQIENEKLEYIEMTSPNKIYLKYTVLPLNASNKEVKITFDGMDKSDKIQIDEKTGEIIPLNVGRTKITLTTIDGAYHDDFTVIVSSEKVIDFTLDGLVDKNNLPLDYIEIGQEFSILTTLNPSSALNTVITWTSSDQSIVQINEFTGLCRARKNGKVTITATLMAGLNGPIVKTYEVLVVLNGKLLNLSMNNYTILDDETSLYVTIDKKALENIGLSNILDTLELNELLLISESNNLYFEKEITLASENDESMTLEVTLKNLEIATYEFNLVLNDESLFINNETLKIKRLSLDEINFEIDGKHYVRLNAEESLTLTCEIDSLEADVIWSASNNIIEFTRHGLNASFIAKSLGTCIIKATIKLSGNDYEIDGFTLEVLDVPTSISIKEAANTYATLQYNHYTFGKYKIVNGAYVDDLFSPTILFGGSPSDYYLTTDNNDLVEINNHQIRILKTGIVTIHAISLNAEKLGIMVEDSFTFEVNENGVNIYSYDDLMKASNEGLYDLVLQVTIGSNTDKERLERVNRGMYFSEFGTSYHTTPTTWDWEWYKNYEHLETAPLLKVAVEFKKDVYGNGFTINAHPLTFKIDSTKSLMKDAIFRGPLNFVDYENGTAAVYGQDNIVFKVDDNVTINNVILKGCDDLGDIVTNMAGGKETAVLDADLNYFNYVGTTVEVMGDNVQILNSRIRNGRTVMRIFGTDNKKDVIHVKIASSVLSYAREFILKIGTNDFIRGDILEYGSNRDDIVFDLASPKLTLPDGTVYQYNSQDKFNNKYINDPNYASLIRTYVTLKNSILETSGIFSIGIESHFSGPALDGYSFGGLKFLKSGWDNLAATSYPAELILEGDVRLYDWKKLANVDSSTLIGGSVIKFDIAALVKAVAEGDRASIITNVDGEEYVHGGIAFYGGGKNYSCIVRNNFTTENFNEYIIGFDDIKYNEDDDGIFKFVGGSLKYAAGKEKFGFLMYSSDSNFNYQKQQADLASGDAYNWIMPE